MPTEVILPRVDMDMTEGKIAFWHVRDGDAVTKGQVLFDIETDKATMEVESPAAGVIQQVEAGIGTTMPVGQVVAWIFAAGEKRSETPVAAQVAAEVKHEAVSDDARATSVATAAPVAALPDGAMLRATPLARSLARERGLALEQLSGTGPRGRIHARDVPASGASAHVTDADRLNLQWWRDDRPAPLVLLHGFGADAASWRPLVQRLPAGAPLLGIDLPNHGRSPLAEPAALEAIAAQIAQRLTDAGVDAFHLLGHSLGGGIAIALASAVPARVRTVMLLAPAGLGPEIDASFFDALLGARSPEALRPVLARLVHDPARITGSFAATAFQALDDEARRAALTRMAAGLTVDGQQKASLGEALASLRMPVKVLWGEEDRIIPITQASALPARVALHRLAGIGHLPQVEVPELVADLLWQQPGLANERIAH